jgi:Putative zinc-finger
MAHELSDVAAYVARELPADRRADFERHLLECEDCSAEVELGSRGRQLARLTREVAPAGLHERVTGAVDRGMRRRRRATVLVVAAAAAGVLAIVGVLASSIIVPQRPPAAVSAAVADFRAQRLPGGGAPASPPPDLVQLGLSPIAAGVGRLAGRTVAAYAYSDGAGRRLLIYESAEPFATPAEASRYEGGDAWLTRLDGVSVLCSRAPHRTLVVGQDEEQVTDTAEYLELT